MISVLPLELIAMLRQCDHSDALESGSVAIIDDKARRPLISVTEASWSEVPPLCRHAPAHATNLKRITVCRWDGVESRVQPKDLGPQSNELEYIPLNLTSKRRGRMHMPTRKASVDMTAVFEYSTPRMPMRKASMDMSAADSLSSDERAVMYKNALQRPMRKVSMAMFGMPEVPE